MKKSKRQRRYHPKKNPTGVDGSGKPVSDPKPNAEYVEIPDQIKIALGKILEKNKK